MRRWDSFVLSKENPDDGPSFSSAWDSFVYHMSRLSDKPTLDIDVVSHCNLNCASCYHFAPIAECSFVLPEELERDLSKLSQIQGIDGFFEAVGLMGGEPLLHPKLAELILLTRRHIPGTELRLWTNGILLEQATDELWEALSETGTLLYITPYPIGLDFAKLTDMSDERGVRTVISGGLAHDECGDTYFLDTPIDPSGSRNPMEAFSSCPTGGCCMHLLAGKLYPCSKGALLDTLNKFFGTQIKHEDGDCLVLSGIRDVQEIEQFRRSYSPMCRYCAHDLSMKVSWRRSRREWEEWLIKEPQDADEAVGSEQKGTYANQVDLDSGK